LALFRAKRACLAICAEASQTCSMSISQWAAVVDEDIDIHNARDVEWAVVTRSQADSDFVIVSNAQGSKLDPSSRDGVTTKLGIDATIPFSAPPGKFARIRVPGEEAINPELVIDTTLGTDRRSAMVATGRTK
jgi:2,5-furandicarboxylate decarboxylase 1